MQTPARRSDAARRPSDLARHRPGRPGLRPRRDRKAL